MTITINIDIKVAKAALTISAASYEQYKQIESMSDEEVKNSILKHIKCWGISEVQK